MFLSLFTGMKILPSKQGSNLREPFRFKGSLSNSLAMGKQKSDMLAEGGSCQCQEKIWSLSGGFHYAPHESKRDFDRHGSTSLSSHYSED